MATRPANLDTDAPSLQPGAGIDAISAVTLVTTDMARAVRFYEALGFRRLFGGPEASFTSFAAGGNYLNLAVKTSARPLPAWGRVIFSVADVDVFIQRGHRSRVVAAVCTAQR